MKVSKAQAAQNRQDIVDAAARLYRERGIAGVGVAEVTRGAGLTHGGLYRHFESKEALVREACARAFDWTIGAPPGLEPGEDLAHRVRAYLSPAHRDSPGDGCPVAALAVDVARAGDELSSVFAKGVERNITRFAQRMGGLTEEEVPGPTLRAEAIATLGAMVGALVLARATAAGNAALSGEILEAMRNHLLGPAQPAPAHPARSRKLSKK